MMKVCRNECQPVMNRIVKLQSRREASSGTNGLLRSAQCCGWISESIPEGSYAKIKLQYGMMRAYGIRNFIVEGPPVLPKDLYIFVFRCTIKNAIKQELSNTSLAIYVSLGLPHGSFHNRHFAATTRQCW